MCPLLVPHSVSFVHIDNVSFVSLVVDVAPHLANRF